MFPFLSLEEVDFDVELAQRLPRRVAYYHLALPVAQDGEGITVAMAHPENRQVVGVLEAALNAKVIPVQSFAEMIRQQLDRIWQTARVAGAIRVSLWAQTEDQLLRSAGYVDALLKALDRDGEVESSITDDFAPSLTADLIAAAVDHVPQSLMRTSASILTLQDATALPKTILHILRGHIPDYRVLDWLIPLALNSGAQVTLLMGVDGGKSVVSDLSSILMGQDKRQAHLAECRRMLHEKAISGRLKLRQESLLDAISNELGERSYDLVAMAAEAYGDFAHQVSEIVRPQTPAFLVIKP